MSHDSGSNTVSNLLTLVITTSPTPSAPATELLSGVLESFAAHCDVVLRCNVIVVFDTYEQVTTTSRLKKGHVTPETAEKYDTYKENVKKLFLETFVKDGAVTTSLQVATDEAEYGSPGSPLLATPVPFTLSSTEDGRVRFIEAQGRRLGFGLGVRSALRAVRTPYVWIHQHDWRLIYDIPVASLLSVMQSSQDDEAKPIKYICLPSGRRSSYATSEQVVPYPELRKVSLALTGTYAPKPAATVADGSSSLPAVPLTPMFFWHDKPHVASTTHYLERVFPTRLAMMRGAFIEDTMGQKARNQMKQGQWRRWATWQYNPDEGMSSCLRHLHGRTWRGEEEEDRRRNLAVLKGMNTRSSRDSSASASESDFCEPSLALIL
ncbi:hypothetical protein NLG97_g8256 [Lecanicillium saksenae]|uniref:Uncharacterized protein n=1 Tax=Lecanicillium saksenae TaxID=468837 RepID=A0ACC1QLU1_9HYPO|nr:hypothetical protein NLG97_g8256 [Lecanicillium saksenae]